MPKIGQKVRLTERFVNALEAPATGYAEVLDGVQRGLALRVRAGGLKTWSVRKARAGRRIRVTLGDWPTLGIADARQKAAQELSAIEAGRDPNAEKRTQRQVANEERQRKRDRVPTTLLELIDRRGEARAASALREARALLLAGLSSSLEKAAADGIADRVSRYLRPLYASAPNRRELPAVRAKLLNKMVALADGRVAEQLADSLMLQLAQWHAGRGKGWREERRTLVAGLKPLLGQSVEKVTADALMTRVRAKGSAGAPVSANRLAQYAKALFRWAGKEGVISGVDPNAIFKPNAEATRDRVLRDDELKAIWSVLPNFGQRGRLYMYALVSAQRRTELAAMAGGRIDRSADVWQVAATKSGRSNKPAREHVVPVSLGMWKVLGPSDSIGDGLLFPTGKGTRLGNWDREHKAIFAAASLALAKAKRRPGDPEIDPAAVPPMQNWTIHDLRRTAATLMGRAGARPDTIERILGHAHPTGSPLSGTYQLWRAMPEMREALDNLARLLGRIVGADLTGEAGAVVPMIRAG